MSVGERLASVDAALVDGDAVLSTDLGGHSELTSARLWRGQVLVDWEPDEAGGCLLRPELLRRLVALHARLEQDGDVLRLSAPGHLVAGLSPEHAQLVTRLGGARRLELCVALRFEAGQYRGGDETYFVVERAQRVPLLRLKADVRQRPTRSSAEKPEAKRETAAKGDGINGFRPPL